MGKWAQAIGESVNNLIPAQITYSHQRHSTSEGITRHLFCAASRKINRTVQMFAHLPEMDSFLFHRGTIVTHKLHDATPAMDQRFDLDQQPMQPVVVTL